MASGGRSRGVAALLLIVLSLFGCSSPEQKVELAERALRSWAATVRMTSASLADGAVPRVYARQVLDAAKESRQQESSKPEWNRVSPATRRALDDALRQLETDLGRREPSRTPS